MSSFNDSVEDLTLVESPLVKEVDLEIDQLPPSPLKVVDCAEVKLTEDESPIDPQSVGVALSKNVTFQSSTVVEVPRDVDSPAATNEAESDKSSIVEGITVTIPETTKSVFEIQSPQTAHRVKNSPQGVKLILISTGLILAYILVALDQTIVAAAVPKIANQFQRLNDVGWYASSYLLTAAATQPIWGRTYGYFNQKHLLFSAVSIFMIGSLICALAKSSSMFIVGRAIAGVAFGGIYIGVVSVIVLIFPLEQQGMFQSLMGGAYGLGATTGPIIGGALTSRVSWRWCFWLNLPVGGVTLLMIAFFLEVEAIPQTKKVLERVLSMDWVGTIVLLGAFTCILLELQDGGVQHPWNSARSIGLLVGFGVLFIIYFAIQEYKREEASINMRLLRNRHILAIAITTAVNGGSYFAMLYELPIYFQAVRGSTPIRSGVEVLPFITIAMIGLVLVGTVVNKTGNFNIMMTGGLAIGAAGAGCCSLLSVDTAMGEWIGLQMIAAFVGMTVLMPLVASQAHVRARDRNASTTIAVFFQTLGGTVLVSVFQSIYQNKLLAGIKEVPGLDVNEVIGSGLSAFRESVAAQFLPQVVEVASQSMHAVFLGIGIMTAIGCVASATVGWINVNAK